MKSLFDDEEVNLPHWIILLFDKVDRDSVVQLRKQDKVYQEMMKKKLEIQNKFSCIEKLMDDDVGNVSLSAEEHKYFLEFLSLKSDMEFRERKLYYWYGHVHCYEYMKKIGAVKSESE